MNWWACLALEVVETLVAFCCSCVFLNLVYLCVQFSELLSCQAGWSLSFSSRLVKLPEAKSVVLWMVQTEGYSVGANKVVP